MADPRNIAHDKKVDDEKKRHGEEVVPDPSETPQPGRKPTPVPNDSPGNSYQQHARLHPGDVPDKGWSAAASIVSRRIRAVVRLAPPLICGR